MRSVWRSRIVNSNEWWQRPPRGVALAVANVALCYVNYLIIEPVSQYAHLIVNWSNLTHYLSHYHVFWSPYLTRGSSNITHYLSNYHYNVILHHIWTRCTTCLQNLENTVNPILNKPKPKEKTPPPSNPTAGDGQPGAAPADQQPPENMDVEWAAARRPPSPQTMRLNNN